MTIEIIEEGDILRLERQSPRPVAVGPRCVVTDSGHLVCVFELQSALGVNDFVPVITESVDDGATWSEPRLVWPHLENTYSVFINLSRSAAGDLFLYGTRTPIDAPGE